MKPVKIKIKHLKVPTIRSLPPRRRPKPSLWRRAVNWLKNLRTNR